jgi:hypothetical protein
MRRSVHILALLGAVLLAGCLAAGCGSAGSTIKGAVSSAASNLPSRSATAPAPSNAAPSNAASVTSQPAASTPAATAAPTTAPATAPGATAAPAAGSGTSLVWLWILLGAVVVTGLIALLTRQARHGSATAADWRSRLIDAYAQGSALHDAMSVAETPGAMVADDAGARWSDIQRRADDLAQTLYALRESVPDPAERLRIADTLASLRAAQSAMDAERAPGGAGPQQAGVVRGRLDAFESSVRALRADDQRYP